MARLADVSTQPIIVHLEKILGVMQLVFLGKKLQNRIEIATYR